MQSKFKPLLVHPEYARCYVCNKKKKTDDLLYIGLGTYRCPNHRQSTILKAGRKEE